MKMIQLTIGVLVAVIVTAAVLVPVMSDATDETKTAVNDGLRYALASDEDEATHTVRLDYVDGETVITSDGEVVDSELSSYTLIYSASNPIRWNGARISALTSSDLWVPSDDGDYYVFTITGTAVTGTGVAGTTLRNYSGTVVAFPSADGDFSLTANPKVVSDSRVIGAGVTYSPFSTATTLYFDGTIDDLSVSCLRPTSTVFQSVTVNTSDVVGNLVKIDSVVLTLTESDVDKVATYTYFLAPYEVVYDNPNYVGSVSLILAVIPMLVVTAIVVGVAYTALRRND